MEMSNNHKGDGMPSYWREVSLAEIATAVGSGITPRGGEKTYVPTGIPLLRSQNVLMNRLSLGDVAYIMEGVHHAMARSSVQPGDLLLNITGASIGRVAPVPEWLPTANVNQHVCRIRLTADADAAFV